MGIRFHDEGIRGVVPAYNLKMIPSWLFQKTQENKAVDPRGMGRETADTVVARSRTRRQLEDSLYQTMVESNQGYFSRQTNEYYKSLRRELESYLRLSDTSLALYMKKK